MLLTYSKQSIGAHSVGFREVEHDKPSIDVALLENVFSFAARMSELDAPPDVLAKLGTAINGRTPLKVLGAARIPVQSRDWLTARLGETVFLSEDVPRGWWEEYANL